MDIKRIQVIALAMRGAVRKLMKSLEGFPLDASPHTPTAVA
jgi:hypothetical protein